MARYGLARSERVVKTAEYRQIQRQGRRVHGSHFTLIFHPRSEGGLRLGIAVSRKVGKAHDRNRLKRWTREFFRTNKHRVREALGKAKEPCSAWGLDLAFTARPGAARLDHQEADSELESLVERMIKEYRRDHERDRELVREDSGGN